MPETDPADTGILDIWPPEPRREKTNVCAFSPAPRLRCSVRTAELAHARAALAGGFPCLASVGKYFQHLLALFPIKSRHHFPVANSQSHPIRSRNGFTALVRFGLKRHLNSALSLDPAAGRSVTQRPGAHVFLMSSTCLFSPPAQMLPWLRGRHLSPGLFLSLLKTGLPALGFHAPT